MTAVPKPLKFLRPFYQELINTFEGFDEKKLENERVSAEKSVFERKSDRLISSLVPT